MKIKGCVSEGALSAAERGGSGGTFWCQGGESHRKYLVSYSHLVQNPCFKHSILLFTVQISLGGLRKLSEVVQNIWGGGECKPATTKSVYELIMW